MNKLFEVITKISTAWSLAAFAIVCLVLIITKLKSRKVPVFAWWVVAAVVILALAPTIAPLYLNSYGIYRVRIIVLDDHQIPTNDATVTCSVGGEIKRVGGGWECDIPSKTKPLDSRVQVYATIADAFLTGHTDIELNGDYSPVTTIQLSKNTSARIMGMIVDEDNNPLEGAHVGVVGYDSEGVTTKLGGNFSLFAHKADGQQVRLFAFKPGYMSGPPEWHMAGDHPVIIVLNQQRSTKHRGT
jgi:hypothetical protein